MKTIIPSVCAITILLAATFPLHAQQKSADTSNPQRHRSAQQPAPTASLTPQAFVQVGYDDDGDGSIDRVEFTSIYDLEKSSQGNSGSAAGQHSRNSQWSEQDNRQAKFRLDPQGWVRVGYDYDDDGTIDRYEYISVYELEQARQGSRASQSAGANRADLQSQSGKGRPAEGEFYTYGPGTDRRIGVGRTEGHGVHVLAGTIQDLREITLSGIEQKHQIAKVKTDSGRTARVDLGPVDNLKQLDLQNGDRITVHGESGNVDGQGMLMAQWIDAGNNRTAVINLPFDRNVEGHTGKVISTRTASFKDRNVPDQVFARVQLDQGGTTAVNLGPKDQLGKIDLQNLKGKQIRFLGHRAMIEGEAALLADRIEIDGQKIRIDWSNAQAKAPTSQSASSS